MCGNGGVGGKCMCSHGGGKGNVYMYVCVVMVVGGDAFLSSNHSFLVPLASKPTH